MLPDHEETPLLVRGLQELRDIKGPGDTRHIHGVIRFFKDLGGRFNYLKVGSRKVVKAADDLEKNAGTYDELVDAALEVHALFIEKNLRER